MGAVEAIEVGYKNVKGCNAVFYLDHERQNINIKSDYGDFQYNHWRVMEGKNTKLDFYKFLKGLNEHYLYEVLSANNKPHLERGTEEKWFNELKSLRRDHEINREEFREIWEQIKNILSNYDSVFSVEEQIYSGTIGEKISEPWYVFEIQRENNACLDMLEGYFDNFIKVIGEKIEEEQSTNVMTGSIDRNDIEGTLKKTYSKWKRTIDDGYSKGDETKVERARGAMFAIEEIAEKFGLEFYDDNWRNKGTSK